MGIRVLIFTYSHQNGVVVGGIWLNEKINMGNYKQKVARKLKRQQNWIEHKWREYFCLRKVNVFGFLQIYFLFQKNQIKMRNSLQYVFLTLIAMSKIHLLGMYALRFPRLWWCEISTSEYPCYHDIPELLKPAKILTLKMRDIT